MAKEDRSRLRRAERTVRGFANHRRIEIMELLAKKPELSIFDIAAELEANFKTISEHVRRLALSGLVTKRSEGAAVRHRLTPQGEFVLKFLRTLE